MIPNLAHIGGHFPSVSPTPCPFPALRALLHAAGRRAMQLRASPQLGRCSGPVRMQRLLCHASLPDGSLKVPSHWGGKGSAEKAKLHLAEISSGGGAAAAAEAQSRMLAAAQRLGRGGDVRAQVLSAYLLSQDGGNDSDAAMGQSEDSPSAWLQLAAGMGDVWALLLLAARHWEGSDGSLERSYTLASQYVGVAACLAQRHSMQQACSLVRASITTAAPFSWSVQCSGSECRLLPAIITGKPAPRRRSGATAGCGGPTPGQVASLPPGWQAGLPNSSGVLGSYDAVAGAEAAWADLQAVCKVVAEVVATEGGLESWALLEVLQEEEQRQVAARMMRLA